MRKYGFNDDDDELFNIAKTLRKSLETPEKKLSTIIVPPSTHCVTFPDFEKFYNVRSGKINIKTPDSLIQFLQEEDWFYNPLTMNHEHDPSPVAVSINPNTGHIIKDVTSINMKVQTWRTGSGHQMPWGGGNAIGRLHVLSKKDFSRFGSYDGVKVNEYFIKTSKGEKLILGSKDKILDIPKPGDQMIAVSLEGDNFFHMQLLRPDPTANYELRGVYCKQKGEKSEKPLVIGAYHMGQDTNTLDVILKYNK